MSAPQNNVFAHLIAEAIHPIASQVAGMLGKTPADAYSYSILLSADGQLPVTHRLAFGSCTAEFAAGSAYLQAHPDALAATTGIPLSDCQTFAANSSFYADSIGEAPLTLEAILFAHNLMRVE